MHLTPPQTLVNLVARLTSRLELGEAASKVLATLVLSEIPLSQTELVRLTGYSLSQVSSALSLLVGLGLVSFVKNGRKRLYYSDKGINELMGEIARKIIEKDLKPLLRELEKLPLEREKIHFLREECNLAIEKLQESFLKEAVKNVRV
jgi:DNA-binding transcriptional regulator GbsR (MarR family)